MWKFMEAIEGFDITRATKCLEKLVYAHYDNMSVLKLATKKDLIEDADLKPGDALLIVSAVKELTPDTRKRACEFQESCEQKVNFKSFTLKINLSPHLRLALVYAATIEILFTY